MLTGAMQSLRPSVMDVDLDALVHNFQALSQYVAPAMVMPVVKANAYGHGIVYCARALEQAGCRYFGVAFLEEAIRLRQAGIATPILVMGGICGRQIEHFLQEGVDITASSVMKLEAIEEAAKRLNKRARVHLKIDTGMERVGIHYYSASALFAALLKMKHIDVVGVFSHLATAEQEDQSFQRLQLERFLECIDAFKTHSLPMPMRHLANSGGILSSKDLHLDCVRPGLVLYGVAPAPHLHGRVALKPVMSIRSEVVYFKVIRQGAGVSYDLTWTASEQTRIATISLGYGDGLARELSNRGRVLIRGKSYPIVGKICMDQCMVNIGTGEAYNGDEVVLLGKQGELEITVEELAATAQTDIRDILLRFALRVPRRYTHGQNVVVDDREILGASII